MALLGWLVLLVLAVIFSVSAVVGWMLTGKLDGEGLFLAVCSPGLWSGVVQAAPFTLTPI
jgi:hypothetical protein